MKKACFLLLIIIILGCARTHVIVWEFKPEQIIHYSKLQKLENVASIYNYAAYLNTGDAFPMTVNLDNDMIGLTDGKVDLVMKRKLFFMLKMPDDLTKEELAALESLDSEKIAKMTEADKIKYFRNIMLSKDAINWVPLTDIKAMKEVFGINGGSVGMGVGMNKKEGIWSYLNVKTRK